MNDNNRQQTPSHLERLPSANLHVGSSHSKKVSWKPDPSQIELGSAQLIVTR